MADDKIPRRRFLAGAGLAGASLAGAVGSATPVDAQTAAAPAPSLQGPAYTVLTSTEVAFFTAAVDTFIPADELTPKGSDCGVVVFIDRQLASAWGGGAKYYRSGPFPQGKPEHGPQSALTPRELFAAGITATNALTRKTYKKDFDRLGAKERDDVLKALESGKAELSGADPKAFFEQLYTITMEGFFSDPIYGGNKDKVSWAMIGFPGLPALYADKIDKWRGKAYVVPPQSIQDFS